LIILLSLVAAAQQVVAVAVALVDTEQV